MIVEYSEKVKMLMQLHYSRLAEKDRRHYAAIEAIKLGYGGVTFISKVLAVDRNTIIQGKKELLSLALYPPISKDRQRRAGRWQKKNGSIPEY